MREFDLLSDIADASREPSSIRTGIGDDAAVLAEAADLVTTDALVEGVHFDLDWCSPADVGWRALAASLSDIAAMGGKPGPFVTSLAAGEGRAAAFSTEMVAGMGDAADALASDFDVGPVGGDLVSTSGPMTISVALLGCTEGVEPVLRGGADPGDRVFLSGYPGRSAAALRILDGEWEDPGSDASLLDAYRRPTARCDLGRRVAAEEAASAMIDVSDGLVADLGHVCDSSGVGARVELDDIPVDPRLERLQTEQGADVDACLLTGGEDFELLLTVPSDRVDRLEAVADAEDWRLTDIGVIVESPRGVDVLGRDGEPLALDDGGFEHAF
ncbi:MAG: thiamine-phosphate kinase [Bradymonadaceae bacterium]